MSEKKEQIKWEEVTDVDKLKSYLLQIFGSEDKLYDELWQDAIPAMHENIKKQKANNKSAK